MKQLFLSAALFMLFGCASSTMPGEDSGVDTAQALVLRCTDGLAKCYSTANKICGSRGFDELDRNQVGHLTSAGRLENQGDGRHVYREDLRIEEDQQTLVIRCKSLDSFSPQTNRR